MTPALSAATTLVVFSPNLILFRCSSLLLFSNILCKFIAYTVISGFCLDMVIARWRRYNREITETALAIAMAMGIWPPQLISSLVQCDLDRASVNEIQTTKCTIMESETTKLWCKKRKLAVIEAFRLTLMYYTEQRALRIMVITFLLPVSKYSTLSLILIEVQQNIHMHTKK